MNRAGVFFIALGLLAGAARGDEWQKRYTVSGTPQLRMDTGDGNVDLRAGAAGVIEARVTSQGYRLAEDDVRIVESQTGNSVTIELKFPRWEGIHTGRRWVRVELSVPPDLRAEVHTGDGNITGAGVAGDLRLSTGDGSIELSDAAGRLDARTGDGRIRVAGRFERLALKTGDGSVDAAIASGSQMAEPWRIGTGDGSVTVRLPEGFAADLDVRTGDGGITVDLPLTTSGKVGGNRLRGRLNGGGQLLTIETGDGSIRVSRL